MKQYVRGKKISKIMTALIKSLIADLYLNQSLAARLM